MAAYVLVHGSWHGAWCWQKVVPRLEGAGHRVVSVELPGHDGAMDPHDVTLERYVECVGEALAAVGEPAVLVGHSRAGIVISQTAERWPERIRVLVYLAAYLIPNGETMFATALSDTESVIVSHLDVNEAQGWHMVRERGIRECLYSDCTEEDIALARAHLAPEPNLPVVTPLRLSAERYGRVPRVYIECLEDRVISPALQRRMRVRLPCAQVISMRTGHSPFLSAPEELAGHLLSVADF